MSNPSLLNIPYRFKASKLYSQIPDSGLGDFTVTRSASNVATRVNASGLIETVADNVPRLDYPLGGIGAGCPALLVEPSAQNLMIQSQDLAAAFNSQANTSTSANVSISPDGTQNADRLTFTTTGGYRLRGFSIVSGTSYTASLFYKNVDYSSGEIFRFQVSDGVVGSMNVNIDPVANTITQSPLPWTNVSSSIENYGNGWYRVRISGTASNTGSGWYELRTNATKSIDLWGFQFETGSVATSYIPTTTATVTRGADVISNTGVSSLIGQTEGTLYAEADLKNWVDVSRIFAISDGTNTKRIIFFTNSNKSITIIVTDTTLQANITTGTGLSNGIYKIALGYANNDFAMYVNGAQIGVDNSGTVPSCSQVFVGKTETSANSAQLNDRIRSVALYTTRLTNAQLAALTT